MTLRFSIHINRLSKKAVGNRITVVHRQGAYFGTLRQYTSAVAMGTCATLLVQQGKAFNVSSTSVLVN